MELDRTFEERDQINTAVVAALDDAAPNWGVKVLRYEIKDLTPPAEILHSMQRQITAEREKRALIAASEGRRQEQINIASGEREASIARSEGERQASINRAQGEASAIVKRSVLVAGHATSVSIEEAFWTGLKDIARERGLSLNALIAAIDADRRTPNLSSAIRLAVLAHYQGRSPVE